jgi:dihydrofolate reductase
VTQPPIPDSRFPAPESHIPYPVSRISIIVAYSVNRVIGENGKMPWHLSEDLKRFKALTMGHTIIMGRKTWASLGRLLPGRRHVIISRDPAFTVPGATVVTSLDQAIAACSGESEAFVIGGGEIYALALPLAQRLYVTEIDAEFAGDTYFPAISSGQWRETARESQVDPSTGLRYAFVTCERLTPFGGR